MKKNLLTVIILAIIGCSALSGCTKDEILNTYNRTIEAAGSSLITRNSALTGRKAPGQDDYTGTYQAEYTGFSGTEYLFGGTSIERAAGKEITVTCSLTVTGGKAKLFWLSGSEKSRTLLDTEGTYTETLTLPDGGNYIGFQCQDFTGTLDLDIQ